MAFLPPDQEPVDQVSSDPLPGTLIDQPTSAPSRKLQFGIWGGVIVAAIIAGLTAYDVDLATTWVPVISAIAGSLGVAVPAYITRNRA